ncbi:MAG TPA: hypothetical protein VEC06_00725, partial [Paucimonas sp.]|nr:hypothetical protein [Paucimonas sp.]
MDIMEKFFFRKPVAAVLGAVSFLSACGGGSGTSSPVGDTRLLAEATAKSGAAAAPGATTPSIRAVPASTAIQDVGFTGQDFAGGLKESLTQADCDPASPANSNYAVNVYNVGPGQAYANINDVPWEALPAHSMVRIFHRTEPYDERIFIVRSQVKVCGVPGPNGEKPVLDGRNARVRNNSALQREIGSPTQAWSTINRGVVAIWSRSGIRDVAVEGLALTGTMRAPYTEANHIANYIGMNGASYPYNRHTACLYVRNVQNVTIRGNEISYCPNGVMAISQDFTYARNDNFMVRNFLLEGNYIHDNGLIGSWDTHQAYVQGVNHVVQYNYFGNPIRYDVNGNGRIEGSESAWGNDVKMRTVGDLIRYNFFQNGSHAIDLIDIEDFRPSVFPWWFRNAERSTAAGAYATPQLRQQMETDYQKWIRGSYVYGNLFLRDSTIYNQAQGASMIHYGYDNSPLDGRRGPLWFYHNTVVSAIDKNNQGAVTLFSCCLDNSNSFDYYGRHLRLSNDVYQMLDDNGQYIMDIVPRTADMMPAIHAVNNAIYVGSQSGQATSAAHPFHWNTYQMERISLYRNWISSNWNQPIWNGYPVPGYGNGDVAETVSGNGAVHPGFFYPGGQVSSGRPVNHVAGIGNLLVTTPSAPPLNLASYQPVEGGTLCNQAQQLPNEIPAAVRPSYQISRVLDANGRPIEGRLQIQARPTLASLGAGECSGNSGTPTPTPTPTPT